MGIFKEAISKGNEMVSEDTQRKKAIQVPHDQH